MLKILHTSDWHLGHVLFGYERVDEQDHMLRQIADVVAQERPDVMLVCGDIFHVAMPSNAALKMFTDRLLDICDKAPDMEVFVTAGNHDSASRLEADRSLWRGHKVSVVGVPTLEVEKMVTVVPGKCVVASVPYFSVRQCGVKDMFDRVSEEVRQVNVSGLPVIFMAHAAIVGSNTSGHDDGIGGMDCVPLSDFGDAYDYLALGHIHRPQCINGSHGRARYCGTPLQVSFDENYPHGVDVVTIDDSRQVEVKSVTFPPLRRLVTLPKEPESFDSALGALGELSPEDECYVRLNVLVDDYLPTNAQTQASEKASGKKCRLCQVMSQRRARESTESTTDWDVQVSDFKRLNPVSVAQMAYREQMGAEMPDDMVDALKMAVEDICRED